MAKRTTRRTPVDVTRLQDLADSLVALRTHYAEHLPTLTYDAVVWLHRASDHLAARLHRLHAEQLLTR